MVKLDHFPNFRSENSKKIFEVPPPIAFVCSPPSFRKNSPFVTLHCLGNLQWCSGKTGGFLRAPKKEKKQKQIGKPRRSGGSEIKPIGSMYAIFTYIWLIFMVNVGEYAIHGSYGKHTKSALELVVEKILLRTVKMGENLPPSKVGVNMTEIFELATTQKSLKREISTN